MHLLRGSPGYCQKAKIIGYYLSIQEETSISLYSQAFYEVHGKTALLYQISSTYVGGSPTILPSVAGLKKHTKKLFGQQYLRQLSSLDRQFSHMNAAQSGDIAEKLGN